MGMGMGVSFQYSMGVGTGMGVIFENGYECGYNSTRPEPAPLPFLILMSCMSYKVDLDIQVLESK